MDAQSLKKFLLALKVPAVAAATAALMTACYAAPEDELHYDECTDGIDNDDNGLTDCEDPICDDIYECHPIEVDSDVDADVDSEALETGDAEVDSDGEVPIPENIES